MTTTSTTNAPTDAPTRRDLTPQLVTIMTTEHYNLQSGRAMTVSDANGRASLFIGTVSSALVALAFVGQISRLGTAFFVFSLVLFPSLFFLGIVTFERTLQSAIEDTIYARGINRIRHLYLEHAPEMTPYFVLSAYDDNAAVMDNMGIQGGQWQLYLSTAGMIAVINSVIAGTFAGLLVNEAFGAHVAVCAAIGAVIFFVSTLLLQRYQLRQWVRADERLPVRFPNPVSTSDTKGLIA